jgi:5-(carboxyamino)imidazole ribonucleotide synthase
MNNVIPFKTIPPGGTIGMLGGGQLGRMFAVAAAQLGYRVIVFSNHEQCPAGEVAYRTIVGELTDRERLDELAHACDVVTLEFENLPVDAVSYLATKVAVYPSPEVLRISQDRRFEKQTFAEAGLAVTPFCVVNDHDDLRAAIGKLGLPLVLKTARDGYDGKGQWKIDESAAQDLSQFVIDRPMIAEAWITYQRELSVIIARSHDGQMAVYPAFENEHRNHILDVTTCPADVSQETLEQSMQLAIQAAETISLVGLMCVEMFHATDGRLMINEVAPRPHNSGHLTIEACHTSQFEQQVRVVCGLPLGDTSLLFPVAAMVNLMGELWSPEEPNWNAVFASPASHLHLYGKRHAATGRKMGHITCTGTDRKGVVSRARDIRDSVCECR